MSRKRNPANVPSKRYKKAKRLWKVAKIWRNNPKLAEEMGVKYPLTEEQVEILKGTAYYHHFKKKGWIKNPPY